MKGPGVPSGARATAWVEADHAPDPAVAPVVVDPWAPTIAPPIVRMREGAASTDTKSPGDVFDFWAPFSTPPAAEPEPSLPDDYLDLPRFDPEARRQVYADDVFDRPLVRRPAVKAQILAALSRIASPQGRRRLLALLTDLFAARPEPATYRVWSDLVDFIDDVAVAALMIELKDVWDTTPAFWCYRPAPKAAPRFSDGARSHFGWAMALRVARAKPHETAENLISHEAFELWSDLVGPCPGFWYFAKFVERRALGDEAEAAVFAALRRVHRAGRATYHHEEFGRLFGGGCRVAIPSYRLGEGIERLRVDFAYECWLAKHENRDPPPTPKALEREYERLQAATWRQ